VIPAYPYVTIPRKPKRDRWGRPMVYPPGYLPDLDNPDKGKVSYTRCTKFIDVIEDPYLLHKYDIRQAIRGLVVRPDLYAKACSQGPTPDKIEQPHEWFEWRSEMDKIGWDSQQAAKSGAKANIGDALHKFAERKDRGLEVDPYEVPAGYEKHLRNYMRATEHITALEIERFMVNDELEVGGTPDRLGLEPHRNQIVVCDVKTGNVDINPAKIARQLAIYSRSFLYDDATGQRTVLDLDQYWGIILALDARTGEMELIDVDLRKGWDQVLICHAVKQERKRKEFTRPHVVPNQPVLPNREEMTPDQYASIEVAIGNAPSEEALTAIWQAAAHVWTPELTERAKARSTVLQQSRHLQVV
jgi:hypothetical protein